MQLARKLDGDDDSTAANLLMLQTNRITLPDNFNYIGLFLTFRCPFKCSYCINRIDPNHDLGTAELDGQEWIDFISRLNAGNVPVSLQGGEPGLHKDFVNIVEGALKYVKVDILTNLAFDLNDFINRIDPNSINREAPYAPIRASYHPEQFNLNWIIARLTYLQKHGFRVGLYGVMHPDNITAMEHAANVCKDMGIDFRTKPFLGWHNDKLQGDYAYDGACSGETHQKLCAPSELLLNPDGNIYPCHHHLYAQSGATGNIKNPFLKIDNSHRPCSSFGQCNPCDVKVKNNRFQQFGHTSVSIKDI